MKDKQKLTNEEFDRRVGEIRDSVKGDKTLGFYIHILFMIGAACSVVAHGAWNILWVLFAFIPMSLISITKPFFWEWTEKRLCADAEAGHTSRAAWWDYLSVLIDWSMSFGIFALVSFSVFALAKGYAMRSPFVWLCVAGSYTIPTVFARKEPGYHWGSLAAWDQWAVIAILSASAFLPIGPRWGLAVLAATGLISVPLCCLWKRKSVLNKVAVYRENAINARAWHCQPPPSQPQSPLYELMKEVFASVRVQWGSFLLTAAALVGGIVWTLCLRRPIAILFALLAVALGYVSQIMVACPKFTPQDEIAKRRLDVDLVRDFVKFRIVVTLQSLVAASIVIMWLGGRDVALLAALSLLAVGSINITNHVEESENSAKVDWLFTPVYALAFTALCGLRSQGLQWGLCLLPLPLFAAIVPAIRWFFPRSGLRGAERMAAIADMPNRLAADIRSDAEKRRDEKAAKRRRRDERRLANFRRSRGE